MSDINNAPPLPRGQMPIEEVFRMMWARMNYLETALKDSKNTSDTDSISGNAPEPITVEQLQNEQTTPILSSQSHEQVPQYTTAPSNFDIPAPVPTLTPAPAPVSVMSNIMSMPSSLPDTTSTRQESEPRITLETRPVQDNTEVMDAIRAQEERINQIQKSLDQVRSQLSQHNNTFTETIDNISTDLSEMNSKYTQMNNFLMEIQTTQITVNNQILRHYNENYSEIMESAIEKSASEKFAQKDEDNDGEENSENVEATTEDGEANVDAPVPTTQETTTTESGDSKTMSFNIE